MGTADASPAIHRTTTKIDVMITAFRDGFQSVFGSRVFSKDYLPAVEATRAAGIHHFEAGGGASFQAAFFYANENAFTVMDAFRAAVGPDANLQTLSRGVNVVGLDSQSSDIVRLHAQMFKKHGMTTIRNFDALNDVENLIFSGQSIHEAGLKHEVAVTLMSLPPNTPGAEYAHTPEFYVDTLKKIIASGVPFDSVCFKDASGTSVPATIFDTIKAARAIVPPEIPIRFHSHDTVGTCIPQYMAALKAGAAGIDLSMAPVSGGTCQSDVLSMWHVLRGSEYDLQIDVDKMREAEEVFKECMEDYFIPPESREVEPLIPFSPMPGGALTANTQMLRDNELLHLYPAIIANMREVVRRGGFGTSVTPVSQFYFQQAFNNTVHGEWAKITEGYGKMVLGYFGKTPIAPDPEIVAIASEQLQLPPTTETVLSINDRDPEKSVKAAEKMLTDAGLPISDENVFVAASCREKGIQFLKGESKANVRKKAPPTPATAEQPDTAPSAAAGAATPGPVVVNVNGTDYRVEVGDGSARVNGAEYRFTVADAATATATATATTAAATAATVLKAPLPGIVIKVLTPAGTTVVEGQTMVVLEAMKMENDIKAPCAGVVDNVSVQVGAQVRSGQALATIR